MGAFFVELIRKGAKDFVHSCQRVRRHIRQNFLRDKWCAETDFLRPATEATDEIRAKNQQDVRAGGWGIEVVDVVAARDDEFAFTKDTTFVVDADVVGTACDI